MSSRMLIGVLILGFLPYVVRADDLQIGLGKQEIVMPSGHLGLNFFPDEPICVLNERPLVFLMTVCESTYLFGGTSWRAATHTGKVLTPGAKGEFDNGYAGVGGIYKDGSTVYAFYHAEDHENKSSPISDARGQRAAMFSIGAAISEDGGTSFRKAGQILTSRLPYEPGKECGGVGNPSVCVDKTNTNLFLYYVDFARSKNQGVQICLARSRVTDKGMPGTWKKYYNGKFEEPGLGGHESYVMSAFEKGGDAYCPTTVYSLHLDRYLLAFAHVSYSEAGDSMKLRSAKKSGIYLATSQDGLNWDEPRQLFAGSTVLKANAPVAMNPTLLITGHRGRGVSGLLLYAFSPNWGSTRDGKFVVENPHHLVGRTIAIVPTEKTSVPRQASQGDTDRQSPTISKRGDSEQERETPERGSPVPEKKQRVRGPSIVGTYRLVLTNEKTERRDPVRRLEIKADNTFTTDIGIQGKWRVTGSRITLTWGTGDAELEVNNGDLSGNLTKGASGNRFRVTATKAGN